MVARDGTHLHTRQAFLRALCCATFYPGVLWVAVSRKNLALHDIVARNTVDEIIMKMIESKDRTQQQLLGATGPLRCDGGARRSVPGVGEVGRSLLEPGVHGLLLVR